MFNHWFCLVGTHQKTTAFVSLGQTAECVAMATNVWRPTDLKSCKSGGRGLSTVA